MAYVTLVTYDNVYITAAITLAHSLSSSKYPFVVLSTINSPVLSEFFDQVIPVDPIKIANWRSLKQPDHQLYDYMFTVLHAWNLDYPKVLYLDANTIPVSAESLDRLFELPTPARSGTTILLTPDHSYYKKTLHDLKTHDYSKLDHPFDYFKFPPLPVTLKLYDDPPYILKSKLISRQTPIFTQWHDTFDEILTSRPHLRAAPEFAEALELHDPKVRAYDFSFKEHIMLIKHLYKINYVEPEHVPIYQLDPELDFIPPSWTKLLFPNIAPFDYTAPIAKLAQYFSTYYTDLLSKMQQPVKQIQQYKLDRYDQDEVALQYTRCMPNTQIIICWTDPAKVIAALTGNIYYITTVNLTSNGAINLLYVANDHLPKQKRYEYVIKQPKRSGVITIILHDAITPSTDYLLPFIKSDDIYITEYFYHTVNLAKTLFNQNSIALLNNRILSRTLHEQFIRSDLHINTMKRWINMYMTELDATRVFIMSSGSLYAHGIRASYDVDFLIAANGSTTADFEPQFYKDFVERTSFKFADAGLEFGKNWKPQWTEKNAAYLKLLGIKSYSEVVHNPRHHMYYNGMKYNLISNEIKKRFLEMRHGYYLEFAVLALKFKQIVGNELRLNDKHKLIFPDYSKNTYTTSLGIYAYDHAKHIFFPEDLDGITPQTLDQLYLP